MVSSRVSFPAATRKIAKRYAEKAMNFHWSSACHGNIWDAVSVAREAAQTFHGLHSPHILPGNQSPHDESPETRRTADFLQDLVILRERCCPMHEVAGD